MPNKYDEKKHSRDQGQFSKIQGGKSAPTGDENPHEDDSRDTPAVPGYRGYRDKDTDETKTEPGYKNTTDQIKQDILNGPTKSGRPIESLHQLGAGASAGYRSSRDAMDAIHTGLEAMHHHGKILQQAVKSMKDQGAKPEEIGKLREGLTALHGSLVRSDKVGAHEALMKIAHGFYHAHGQFDKEAGGIAPIAPPAKPMGMMDRMGKVVDDTFGPKGDRVWQRSGISEGAKSAGQGAKGLMSKIFGPGKKEAAALRAKGANFDAGGHKSLGELAGKYGYKPTKVHKEGSYEDYEHPKTGHLIHRSWTHTDGAIAHWHPDKVGERTRHENLETLHQRLEKTHGPAKPSKHGAKFGLDDLPAKPTPEDFDKAVGEAKNVKIKSWDHRYVDMDRLLPSENKEADDEFVKKVQDDHLATPPIVVRPHGSGYNILDGHHRYAAHKKAGHKGMWAVVVKDGDYMRDHPPVQTPSPVTVNIHQGTTPVTFKAGDVKVEPQEIRVEGTTVNVAPAKVDNHVKVEPTPVKFIAEVLPAPVHVQKSPEPVPVHVHVNPTPVTVQNNVEAKSGEVKVTADVKMPEPKAKEITFKTGKDGKVEGATVR